MRVGLGREIRKETTWEEDKDLRNKGRIKDDKWQEAIKGTLGMETVRCFGLGEQWEKVAESIKINYVWICYNKIYCFVFRSKNKQDKKRKIEEMSNT